MVGTSILVMAIWCFLGWDCSKYRYCQHLDHVSDGAVSLLAEQLGEELLPLKAKPVDSCSVCRFIKFPLFISSLTKP